MDEYLLPLMRREEVAHGTMAFWFDVGGRDLRFQAGQNADFTLINPPTTDAEGNTRTFSLASSPTDHDSVMIATRMRQTAYKRVLGVLPIGSILRVSRPTGSMTLPEETSKPVVLIAGGIGITPMRSIVAWATETRQQHDITLLYSNRTPADAAFLPDLDRWQRENARLRVVLTVTDSDDPRWKHDRGRIDASMLRQYLSEPARAVYALSGPPAMVVAMRQLVIGVGGKKDNIRTESFSGY